MKRADKALNFFDTNFNCSQPVLAAFADESGLSEDESLRVASAFGGGMSRQQFTCGAVTGASMAIGLKFGKGKNDSDEKKVETYEKTLILFNEFKSLHGSTDCLKLLNNLDMNDPEDLKTIREQDLFHINCRKYVSDAVRLTEKIIETLK